MAACVRTYDDVRGRAWFAARVFITPVLTTLILTALIFAWLPGAAPALAFSPPQSAANDFEALGDLPASSSSFNTESFEVQAIFRMTNQARAAQGLGLLRWSPELALAARAHAQVMAAHRELSHRYAGEDDLATRAGQAGAHFSSVAENIAQGGGAAQLQQAWMHSPPHRANILDPRMDALGVAVLASGGTLYAVQDFAATVALLTPQALEDRIAAALRNLPEDDNGDATGPGASLVLLDREEARRSCELDSGLLPGSRARFVMRWQSSELTLPQALVAALRSGRYPAAAVGACRPSSGANRGFVVYRVAVLLY